jgi:hypothetical protein
MEKKKILGKKKKDTRSIDHRGTLDSVPGSRDVFFYFIL